MLVQALLGEFLQEAESTRKLLNAIPQHVLEYKPSENSWTTGQLAWHIAEIYNWYPYTVKGAEFNMDDYEDVERDYSDIEKIKERFERNFSKAKESLESITDENLDDLWKMTVGGQVAIPETPRAQIIRGFLMNHIYHHRGEMIVYLRLNGCKIPGLYGPTFEDEQAMQAKQ